MATLNREKTLSQQATKDLKFAGIHLQSVLDGTKQLTIRHFDRTKHRLYKDDVVNAIFLTEPTPTIVPILITEDVRILSMIGIPDSVAKEDGFTDWDDMYNSLRMYYPTLDTFSTMGVIRFRLIRAGTHV